MADSEDVSTELRRPRDLAVMLLALSGAPPRARARDQQADLAGAALRRRVLDRLAALDPEPETLEQTLATIVAEFGEPSGPTRGISNLFLQEWAESQIAPGYWSWLIAEAIDQSDRRRSPGAPRVSK